MPAPRLRLVLTLAMALAVSACSSGRRRPDVPKSLTPAEVPGAIDLARAELDQADGPETATERLRVAVETPGLEHGLRTRLQREFENVVERRIEELESAAEDPEALKELSELEVARRLAVRAGVSAARIWLAQGERVKCFRHLRSLDERFPLHSQRTEAGALLAKAGLSLANDPDSYGFFFTYRALAPQILEYLVTEYPSDSSGPEALVTLAGLYEESREYLLAQQRHEDLILYFPEDWRLAGSQAAIPRLRLDRLTSPEYDRTLMQTAREELEIWLGNYPDHPLRPEVETLLHDALGRLADNDLLVARFYRTVGNPTGAEFHARRAMTIAQEAENPGQLEEARKLLEETTAMQPQERS
ncbi:MAG: hypothetical protein ACI8QC_003761 [Planctomycetota bacterium]|jgi:hypothetical protein